MQESASVYDEELHKELVRSILARYLADYNGKAKRGTPRFLLNDLNRYWFTVAVDYQAKRWERLNRGWGIRYLKLLVSRRLSYVGGVIPLLLCGTDQPAGVDHLAEEYARPALARVASLALQPKFEEKPELKTVLECAARFNEVLSDINNRTAIDNLAPDPEPGSCPIFEEMHVLTRTLDSALRTIFSGSVLSEPVKKYLIL